MDITLLTIKYLKSNKYRLYPMNPSTPLMYGLLKIHKPLPYPVRPVVSYNQSPASCLSKWLNHIILSQTNFSNPFSIKNSKHLTTNISQLKIPATAKLISFDIKNLFPSIPPDDCIENVRTLLFEKSNLNTFHILNICLLVDTVLKQNFFQFNNKVYSQNSGLAMGSNLSPLLAEIFLYFLEQNIKSHPLFAKFLFYYRYVDDILVAFTGTVEELDTFHQFINRVHPAIEFTIEHEHNNSINFLDLTITKNDSELQFSIFHKPSSTDNIIPYYSNHPINHKLGAFHSLFHRLFNIPMNNSSFNKELSFISQLARNNDYPLHIINKIYFRFLNKHINKNLLPTVVTNKPIHYISLPYFGSISYSVKNTILKYNNNIHVSFKTHNNLKSYIVNNKDDIDVLQKSGVYKLNCSHSDDLSKCDYSYIGRTGRRFNIRIKDHISLIERNKNSPLPVDTKSNFADHILNAKHSFNPDTGVEILHVISNGRTSNLWEIYEINKAVRDPTVHILNEQVTFDCLPFFNSLDL